MIGESSHVTLVFDADSKEEKCGEYFGVVFIVFGNITRELIAAV